MRELSTFSTRRGMSLLEVLIVVAILAFLAKSGVNFYRNAVRSMSLDAFTGQLSIDLKRARSRAMSGEGGVKWGVHAVNGARDYYEIFSTPTTYVAAGASATTTVYLPQGIDFTDPSSGSNKDIIFTGISGTTTASTLTVTNNEGRTKTLTIGTQGTVY